MSRKPPSPTPVSVWPTRTAAYFVGDLSAQVGAIIRSGQVDTDWYYRAYPDARGMGLSAPEHYARFGAALGYNPNRSFDTTRYLRDHPVAGATGLNPLLHFLIDGHAGGRRRETTARVADVKVLRNKLLALGFTKTALDGLQALAGGAEDPLVRAEAALELARWYMRSGSEFEKSLQNLERAREAARSGRVGIALRRRIAMANLVCLYLMGRNREGAIAYEDAAMAGEATPDLLLARGNLEATADDRCRWINGALAAYGIPPIVVKAVDQDDGETAYDRMSIADPSRCPPVEGGPKVTVLLAAYNAGRQIRTALRSLQLQTWRNIEVIVVDDCSRDDTGNSIAREYARTDSRFQFVSMETNGGAYIARNRGLDLATGDYVTIHDADDWSHPLKIETQVRFMEDHPEVMGCTSDQARMTADLRFTWLRGGGVFVTFNTSSFLFRRTPVCAALGYWDTVRFGADSEFIARVRKAFGQAAVAKVATGPLSFQRHHEGAVTVTSTTAVDLMRFGVRREYFRASTHYHDSGGSLQYGRAPTTRPFPVPRMMLPDRSAVPRVFDVVVAGDLGVETAELSAAVSQVREMKAQGMKAAFVELLDPAGESLGNMCPAVSAEVDGETCEILVYGETAYYKNIVLVGSIARRVDVGSALPLMPDRSDHRFLPTMIHVSLLDDAAPGRSERTVSSK